MAQMLLLSCSGHVLSTFRAFSLFLLSVQSVQSVQGSYRSRAVGRTGYRSALIGLIGLNMAQFRGCAVNSGVNALHLEVAPCVK